MDHNYCDVFGGDQATMTTPGSFSLYVLGNGYNFCFFNDKDQAGIKRIKDGEEAPAYKENQRDRDARDVTGTYGSILG